MKRIEVSLNLGVVAPLLDFIKPVLQKLEHETALAPEMAEADRDLAGLWREGLIHTQTEDCRVLLGLFDAEFFETGRIALTEENGDRILRAASAVRLKLREAELPNIPDAMLEGGELNLGALTENERTGFAAYLFLATLQEIVIQHLAGE